MSIITDTAMINKITCELKLLLKNKYGGFMKAVETSGAIISGSFILQCLYGKKWNDSDIDIYARQNKDDYSDIDKYLFSHAPSECYFNSHSDFENADSRSYKPYYNPYSNTSIGPNIIDLTNYIIDKNIYQVILMKETKNKLIDDVFMNYDFNICKSAFYIDNGEPQLYLSCLDQIIEKKSTINYNVITMSSFKDRLEKYTSRGINISIDKPSMKRHWLYQKYTCHLRFIKKNDEYIIFQYDILPNIMLSEFDINSCDHKSGHGDDCDNHKKIEIDKSQRHIKFPIKYISKCSNDECYHSFFISEHYHYIGCNEQLTISEN
jgi:hypothetical protein